MAFHINTKQYWRLVGGWGGKDHLVPEVFQPEEVRARGKDFFSKIEFDFEYHIPQMGRSLKAVTVTLLFRYREAEEDWDVKVRCQDLAIQADIPVSKEDCVDCLRQSKVLLKNFGWCVSTLAMADTFHLKLDTGRCPDCNNIWKEHPRGGCQLQQAQDPDANSLQDIFGNEVSFYCFYFQVLTLERYIAPRFVIIT
jgi:hypothetical protein